MAAAGQAALPRSAMGMVVSAAVAAIPLVEQDEQRRSRLRHLQQQNKKQVVSQYHPSLYSPKKRNKPEVRARHIRVGLLVL